VSLAFEQLRFSTEQLSEGGRDTTLTTFASKWLLPRLGSFRPAHPDIDIRIGASTDLVDFVVGGSDVGIRYGHGDWKGLRCDRLMGDEILPVCSPSLMAEGPALVEPADLAHHTLLRVNGATADDWPRWFEAVALPAHLAGSAKVTAMRDWLLEMARD
jgi:LysR family glycine cleavage system transcriptional activator